MAIGASRGETPNGTSNGAGDAAVSGRFKSIPILSLGRARNPETKPTFLVELRNALLNVGFCYISDTGLPSELVQQVKDETFKFFDESLLPLTEKGKIEMKNEKSFLGWSRVSKILNRHLFALGDDVQGSDDCDNTLALLISSSQHKAQVEYHRCSKRWTRASQGHPMPHKHKQDRQHITSPVLFKLQPNHNETLNAFVLMLPLLLPCNK